VNAVEGGQQILRWVLGTVAALAVVALLVWGDRQAGVDDRDTDPEDVQVTIEITTETTPAPLSTAPPTSIDGG
jgi:hypothetical protein